MHKLKITWNKRTISLLLAVLPIIFLAGLVFAKSVNVPYWDQWEFVPVIKHVQDGHFYFNDFWQQQNEHRLFFPRLVMIGSAVVTRWNVRAENAISLLLACVSFVLLIKTVSLTDRKNKHKLLLLPLLLSIIWFSPVQVENWLWGWQIQWFLNVLGVMMIAHGLARFIKDKALSYGNLAVMVSGGVLASYSLGNGVLIWPLLIIALLYLRAPFKKTSLAVLVGAVTTGLYYYQYKTPTPEFPKTLVFKDPVLFIKYFLTYLGRPLSFLHTVTPIPGLLLLMTFTGLCAYLLLKKRDSFRRVVPWVVMGLYAIGSATITALSRMALGLGQSYSSRYTTISLLLLVATIMIAIDCTDDFKRWFGKYFKAVAIVTTTVVVAMVLANFAWGIHSTNQRSQDLHNEKTCTHTIAPTTVCLLTAYPAPSVVQERIDYLKQIHWGGY